MPTLTLSFSTHRPETIPLTGAIMANHDVIIMEDPPHPEFGDMLNEKISLNDYLLQQDTEYPDFSRKQHTLIKKLAS